MKLGSFVLLSRLMIAMGIFLSSTVGFAAAFKIEAAGNWNLVSKNGDNAIYKKSKSKENERIVLQVLPAKARDQQLLSHLDLKKLTFVREKFLNRVGIGNYTALSVEMGPAKDLRFKNYTEIESIYRDFKNQDVQMIERQFVAHGAMYVISYMIDGVAVDRKHARALLDLFQPLWNSENRVQNDFQFESLPFVSGACKSLVATGFRYFSAEAYAAGELAEPLRSAALSWHNSSNSAMLASSTYEFGMSEDEIAQKCKDVSPEKRRKASDDTFQGQIGTFVNAPGSCLVGVAKAAWEIAKGAVNATRDIFVIQGKMLKLMYDGEYRLEVESSAGAFVSEIEKAPKDFAKRMAEELGASALKYVGETFPCLSPAEQTKVICNLASNLLSGGLLAKVMTKVPLAAQEAGQVEKYAHEALAGIYGKAPAAKKEIDELAGVIAKRTGGTVAEAPIKTMDRALEKAANAYGGDVGGLKDLARNTIVVPKEKIPEAIESMKAMRPDASVKIQDHTTNDRGWTGVNVTVKTKAGIPAEIQINSPEMIFAGFKTGDAKSIIGDSTYKAIEKKTGLPGGLSHLLYEGARTLPEGDQKAEMIKDLCRQYHNLIRERAAGQSGAKVSSEMIDLKKRLKSYMQTYDRNNRELETFISGIVTVNSQVSHNQND